MVSFSHPKIEATGRWYRQAAFRAASAFAMAVLGAATQADDAPPQSFENLLRELQSIEERAADEPRLIDRDGLASMIDRVVTARNEVYRRDGGLFNTVLQTIRVEGDYVQATRAANAAAAQLAAANARRAAEEAASWRQQRETPQLSQARADAVQAEANLRQKQETLQAVTVKLNDLYARLRRNLPEFFRNYVAMRNLLPHERGPLNATLAELLRNRRESCPEWVEGQVLMGIAEAYAGNVTNAEACLERAGEIMRSCPPLITTTIAEDCCSTWLLLGKADKVQPYVSAIRKTDPRLRTAAHEWLLGADARVRGRFEDAAKSLASAVGKAKKRAPPALVAETAFALLLADSKGRRTAKAADLLQPLKSDDSWPVLQSRAALAAAEGRWGDAIRLIESCQTKSPPCLDMQLAAQLASYEQEKFWRP